MDEMPYVESYKKSDRSFPAMLNPLKLNRIKRLKNGIMTV